MDDNIDRDEHHGEQDMPETILSLADIKCSIEENKPLYPVNEILASIYAAQYEISSSLPLPNDLKRKRPDFEGIDKMISVDRVDDVFLDDDGRHVFNAAGCGDISTVQNFISKYGTKKTKNLKDINECSILHSASGQGQFEMCEFLISYIKFDVNMKDMKGDTPLHYAVLGEMPDSEEIRERYAKLYGTLVPAGDQRQTISLLLKHGADVNLTNLAEHSALHVAARAGNLDAIDILIERGCDDIIENPTADYGTPLRCAAAFDRKDALNYLLKHRKANANIVPKGCLSPLLTALTRKSERCAKELIRVNADVNYKAHGITPLEAAISLGSIEIVKSLLERGAKTNVRDIYGLLPIELAAMENNRDMVELLHQFPIEEDIEDSVDGVMSRCCSENFKAQINQKAKDVYSYYLSEANKARMAGKYMSAIIWYSLLRFMDDDESLFLARRSLCYAAMKHLGEAIDDASQCTQLNPNCTLGIYATGVALNLAKQYAMAAVYFERLYNLHQDDKFYEDALREAIKNVLRSYGMILELSSPPINEAR